MRNLEVPQSVSVGISPLALEVQFTGGETTIHSQLGGEATVNSFNRQEGDMSLQENTLHNTYRPEETVTQPAGFNVSRINVKRQANDLDPLCQEFEAFERTRMVSPPQGISGSLTKPKTAGDTTKTRAHIMQVSSGPTMSGAT